MSSIRKLLYLRKLRTNQWLRADDLKKIQEKMLKSIIKYSYYNVPFYHSKFKSANIHPSDIKSSKDLEKIPITTKKEVRENFAHMIARNIDISKCTISSTSGSTGIPLKMVYDEKADDYSKAVNIRSHIENGLKVYDRWVEITNPLHIVKKRWFQKLGIFNPNFVSTELDIEEQVKQIVSYRPSVLSGFTSSVYPLSRYIYENDMHEIKPNAVFTTGEMLDDEARDVINRILNVNVIDLFGCVELNRTAWECSEHMGYHMDIDSVLFEFLRNGEQVSSGESGEIIYTGLYNYAMPLIRYSIGDVGTPTDEKCSCGRGLPLMKNIEGRRDDFIILPNKIISPRVFSNLMKNISGIKAYKIIQKTKSKILFKIVKENNYSNEFIEDTVLKQLLLSNIIDLNIAFEFVDEIPKEKKLRKVVSEVSMNSRL